MKIPMYQQLQKINKCCRFIVCMVAGSIVVLAGTGCHSHFVEADVKNASGYAVTLVEVDYPSASFGKDILHNGSIYHYRFKILGNGPAKILWTDRNQVNHGVSGPSLSEGQEGTLTVTITGATAIWKTSLH